MGLGEALQAHLADRLELEVRAGVVDHRPGDQDLAARGAGGHARRQVHLASVVVAVAVERLAVVDADAGQWPLVVHELEADGPVGQRRRVGADDHHLVADRLDHPRVVRERVLDRLDEALDRVERLLLALLLRQPRIAREVREGDGDAQAAEIELVLPEVGLHVPDHVLLDEVGQEALVDVIHHRRGQRQQLAGQRLHLLGHLQAADAVAHEGLVDVEVEEANLGIRHLGDRLAIDADELEERDQREAGGQHRGDVAEELEVLLADVLERVEVEARPSSRCARSARSRARCRGPPRPACSRRVGSGNRSSM